MWFTIVPILLVAIFSIAAQADEPKDQSSAAAEWAWSMIENNKVADFDNRPECKNSGKIQLQKKIMRTPENCRYLMAKYINEWLKNENFSKKIGSHGLQLKKVEIVGDIDLENEEIKTYLSIESSVIEGEVNLDSAHLEKGISLDSSILKQGLKAPELLSDEDVSMKNDGEDDGGEFYGDIILRDSHVRGGLYMSAVLVTENFDLSNIEVEKDVVISGKSEFRKNVYFASAKLAHNLRVISSELNEITFSNAKIGGYLDLQSSTFLKELDASGIEVQGSLYMHNKAFFGKDVDLTFAYVRTDVDMHGSAFRGSLNANRLRVDGPLYIGDEGGGPGKDTSFTSFVGDIHLSFARAETIDLRNVIARNIDLSGINTGELRLSNLSWNFPRGNIKELNPGEISPHAGYKWPLGSEIVSDLRCTESNLTNSGTGLPFVNLRNAHIQYLADDDNTWPPCLDLQSFQYEHLGGLGADGIQNPANRPSEIWVDWLKRDHIYHPQSYTALSAALIDSGRRETANDVLYAGRERERFESVGDLATYLWLSSLSAIAGYGIGAYTFRVLWWIVLLTCIGAGILWYSPPARERGLLWRLGASFQKLLPIVEFSASFKEFFDDSIEKSAKNLTSFQKFAFSVISLLGWVLSFFLLAAMAGLTQK